MEKLIKKLQEKQRILGDANISDDMAYYMAERIDNDIVNEYTIEQIEKAEKIIKMQTNDKPTFKCCICGKLATGYGNNPFPIKQKGECCNTCDIEVMKARLLGIMTPQEYEEFAKLKKEMEN